jgi:uncharacterized protein involved in type VI secretion and phage assembly
MSANQPTTTFSLSFDTLQNFETHVVRFNGKAAMNAIYEFKVTILVSTQSLTNTDWDELLNSPVNLVIDNSTKFQYSDSQANSQNSDSNVPSQDAWRATWHGRVTSMETGLQVGDYTFLEI